MKSQHVVRALCLGLALATLLLYLPVTHHQFISFDDDTYIYDNPQVKAGLTWPGALWALRTGHGANWHPVTWISHMLDCQLYGLEPGGHHLTNVLFHALNSVLLFLLLRRMTGAIWRSALVAALFAWHPLHVESVAWASERKDVLSTLFFLLTLMAYVKYVQSSKPQVQSPQGKIHSPQSTADHPGVDVQGSGLKVRGSRFGLSVLHGPSRAYALALLLFALGLMSKPMLVTLPFVLFLLDVWPLGRVGHFGLRSSDCGLQPSLRELVYEKVPFFALALASSVITFLVQRAGGAVRALDVFPLNLRIANALLAYVKYLGKTFWPVDLSIIYPLSRHMAAASVVLAAVALVGLSVLVVLRTKREPWFAVGWFWFLGTLVPTIGLVQVGSQAMADRYMYIPSIGLFIAVVWGAAAIRKELLAAVAVLVLPLAVGTSVQLEYWQNNQTLFSHAVKVTKDNFIAYNGLGNALDNLGKHGQALACYQASVKISPFDPEGQYDLGTALMRRGQLDEAMALFNQVLQEDPRFGQAHNDLGKACLQKGNLQEAAAHFSEAIRLRPFDAEAHYNLGTIWLTQSKLEAAVEQLSQALQLKPDYWEAHSNLGIALMRQRKLAEGAAHLAEALRLYPDNPEGQANLGLALLELNQPGKAADRFSTALRLKPGEPRTYYRLAQALAREGKTGEAATNAQKARDLAQAAGETQLAADAAELLRGLSP